MKKSNKSDYPRAIVRQVKGKLVLHDPDALEMSRGISKANCRNTLEVNADRVVHFRQRLSDTGLDASKAVIVLLNVNDQKAAILADVLMPGYNWQKIRDMGEIPIARGLAMRPGIQAYLDAIDKEAAGKLAKMNDVAVVVIDHGVAEVFAA